MAKLFGSAVRGRSGESAVSDRPSASTNVSNIKDLVMEGRRKLNVFQEIKDAPIPIAEISSFELKEFLRERIGNLSIEGTISEMFSIITNMEGQLQGILDINSSMEKDLSATQNALESAGKERDKLTEKIRELEDTLPLRKELQQEKDELVEELQQTMEEKQDLLRERDKAMDKRVAAEQRVAVVTEEKNDSHREIAYIQSNVEELVERVREGDENISSLKGEALYFQERMVKLEEELSDTIQERNAIEIELKECKASFDEIYDALIETRVKTKKFFYQELKKQTAEV